MASKQISPFLRTWYRWKTLRLPWRKRFLVGLDLHGNTFWEFRDLRGNGPGRWRRIVQYPGEVHHADVKVSPQWHQWLRHTREKPPSLVEQRQDVARQEQMKLLAAEADARWEARPSLMDAPGREQGRPLPTPADETDALARRPDQYRLRRDSNSGDGNAERSGRAEPESTPSETERRRSGPAALQQKHRLGKPAPTGPSEGWQPQAWSPGSASASKR